MKLRSWKEMSARTTLVLSTILIVASLVILGLSLSKHSALATPVLMLVIGLVGLRAGFEKKKSKTKTNPTS